MRSQPRSRLTQPDSEAIDLLNQLLESSPAPRRTRPVPIVLRGFLRCTWIDFGLKHAELMMPWTNWNIQRLVVFADLLDSKPSGG